METDVTGLDRHHFALQLAQPVGKRVPYAKTAVVWCLVGLDHIIIVVLLKGNARHGHVVHCRQIIQLRWLTID